MLENHEDWAISSQDPYRVRFRDHRKGTVTIIVQLSRVDSNESKREGVLMTIGIYCIRNNVNGKVYVGKSINIESRFKTHRYLLNSEDRSKDCNRYLYNSVKKYGIENFSFDILESFDTVCETELSDAELKWMIKLRSTERDHGYNLRMDSSTKSVMHRETRALLSESRKGSNNANYGKRWTDDMKIRASDIAKKRHASGKYYDDAWRTKISESSREMWKDEGRKMRMAEKVSKSKTIYDFYQYDKQGVLIRKWDSVRDIISENPNYKWQNIYSVCSGHKKTYMGYIWKKKPKI